MKKHLFTILPFIFLMALAAQSFAQALHEPYHPTVCIGKNGVVPADNITSIFSEDFSGANFPPDGWSIVGDGQTNWTAEATSNAGGAAPEVRFYWNPNFVGTSRLVTPAIATSGYSAILLSFNHLLDDYGAAGSYTLYIETTSDGGTTWNEVWSLVDPGANAGPETIYVLIDNDDVGSDDFQVAFTFDGDSYELDWWNFDDVMLDEPISYDAEATSLYVPSIVPAGDPVTPMGVVTNKGSETITFDVMVEILEDGTNNVYSETLTVTDLSAFDTETLTFPDWTSYEGNFVVEMTTMLSGDENPDNDMLVTNMEALADVIFIKPLYEEFTSSTCAPCAAANPFLDGVLQANPETHSLIKYQMDWPGSGDPYYTEEGGDRQTYYGVTYVPDLYINAEQHYPGDMTQALYDSYIGWPTGLEIEIVTAEIDDNYNITVEANIDVAADYAAGLTAHIVVVEKVTVGNVATNGETEFYNVMMKMLPDAFGTTLPALTPGTTETLSESYDMSETNMEEASDLAVVVFVQDDSDKSIVQSETANVQGEFDIFDVTFNIEDEMGIPIEGAEIFLEGNGNQVSNASGTAVYEGVFPGTYAYDVSAAGYFDASGSVEVLDEDVTVTVTMEAPEFYWFEMFDEDIPADWMVYATNPDFLYWYDGHVIFFRQSGTSNPLMLVTPLIDITDAEMLYFDMGEMSGNPFVSFGVVTDPMDPSTFTEHMSMNPGADWETYEFDLTTISEGESEVYLAWQLDGTTYSFFSFDNVIITEGGATPGPCEDFDDLIAGGYVAEQLGGYWTTWSGTPGTAEDALVTDAQSYSPDNSFIVDPNVDLVFQFGDDPITTGAWLYSHQMYVASGTAGYYNVQSEPTPGVAWVIELFFNVGGTGEAVVDGVTTEFTYPEDEWFWAGVNIDVDNGLGEFWINDEVLVYFVTANTIGGIDYFGGTADDAAYYDDVCLEEGYIIEPPVLAPPANLSAEVVDEDIVLTWDAPAAPLGSLLCVDRDGSTDLEFTDDWQFIQPALDNLGIEYTYIEVADLTGDGPDLATMQQYDMIFWFCGEGWQLNQTMSDNDEANLASYLDGGGNLLLSGHDYLWDRYSSAGNLSSGQFPYDYLGVASAVQDTWFITGTATASAVGVGGSFADGLSFSVIDIYTTDKDGLYIDELTSLDVDLIQVTNPAPSGMGAVQFDGGGFRTAFTTLSIAAMTEQAAIEDFMSAALSWLSNGDSDDLTGYNVYYQYEGGGFELAATVTGTEFIHEEAATIPGMHEYYVTAVYDEGESDPTDVVEVLISGVSNNVEDGLTLFPNPASSIVQITGDQDIEMVTVYNFAGQKTYTQKIGDRQHTVDVSKFNPGVYLFRIKTRDRIITKRMIVE